jgi:hypothetical protein
MGMRAFGRWICLFAIAGSTAVAVASCGSGGPASSFNGGPQEDGSISDGGGGSDVSLITTSDGSSDGGTCKTCQELGYTCGFNGDGCGHVLNCGGCTAPEYCGGGGYSKCGGNSTLEPDGAPPCTPTTCSALGYDCGPAGDGCGNLLSCGSCTNPQYCGGGGFNLCGGNDGLSSDGGSPCVPTTCAALGYTCGFAGDGCGGLLTCGTCSDPQFCGGGGFNVCGGNNGLQPDGAVPCTPATCTSLGFNCGIAADGCGHALNCGSCSDPQYCGGGGYDVCGGNNGLNTDGSVPCTPTTCAALKYNCGAAGDGCGGTLNCGSCTNPEYCGGGGFSVCGGNDGINPDGSVICTPTTCAALKYNCGFAADGCGGTLNCGTCSDPQYCGGGGYDVCGGNNGLNTDGSVPCTPTTCATLGFNCGVTGDGCGGTLNCGTCTNPQTCGGGGKFSVCGGNNGLTPDGSVSCTPTTCAALGYNCGTAADGCGGTLNCGTCNDPQFCGGGGYDLCGGNNGLNTDGSVPCTPTTCAALGYNCGKAGDGCGGTLNCGSCTNPAYCGGGGFNVCGGNDGINTDGSVICTPTTCAKLGYNCGAAADGCGGTLNCGTCTDPQYCGGGGYDVCGGNNGLNPDGGVPCKPETCSSLGYTCGTAGDGCGGTLSCGTCVNPKYCGGGGFNVCGGNNGLEPDGGVLCTPATCASLKYNCGYAGDGCGGVLNCGTCTSPQYCGGGGYDICGPASYATCDSGSTSLTGYVFDPANNLPVYNALVYIPVGSVVKPTTGVATAQCGCSAPLAYASAYTDVSGKFVLTNPPTGAQTVVVQLGKWQRTFTETITACSANTLGGGAPGNAANLTLPSTHTQGNIPLFAVDTGNVDSLECILLQMGVAQSEFINGATSGNTPPGPQRVHVYQGNQYANGSVLNGSTPTELTLTGNKTLLEGYDAVLFACQGGAATYPNSTLTNLAAFTANGGRMFATHFHYDLIETNSAFSGSANWNLGAGSWGNLYSDPTYNTTINTAFATGTALGQWLNQTEVYGGTLDSFPVGVVRQDFNSVNAPAVNWLTTTGTANCRQNNVACTKNSDCCTGTCGGNGKCNGSITTPGANLPIHYTFDTPFTAGGTDGTCGRVVYSDFHVESEVNNNGYDGTVFPAECPTTNLATPQEELLEFMIFNLTSCVTPATCTPLTCANYPAGTCGVQGDGCGGQTANCGSCTAPQTCGGGGTPGVCGYPDAGTCTPKTCANFPGTCGVQGDGCGGLTANCGTCTPPATCGGGGVPNQCGYPDGGNCKPKTCANFPGTCGQQGDGCGGLTANCGTCTAPQTCGGGGVPNECGYPNGGACTPKTCADFPGMCGQQGDGCGGLTANCGTCTAPATCGGGGTPGVCGYPDAGTCTPKTCADFPGTCGVQGDGCGGLTANCGTCTAPQTCGGGGVPNHCGYPDAGTCVGLSCAQQGIDCGPADDGCGNVLQCGNCSPPLTCGGGGTLGVCGYPDAGSCTPKTCADQMIDCGSAGDGCGNAIQCGQCTAPLTCGGGGVSGQCGYPDAGACTPLSCTDQGLNCGPAGDGCGNTIQCGPCNPPETCGGGGVAGVCGYPDAGACIPQTCSQLGFNCGPAGDGCGNEIMCGNCAPPETCGGGGIGGVCGFPDGGTCPALTCAQQNITCGPAGDGCGNEIMCGTCNLPDTCGGGGIPGQCGAPDGAVCAPRSCAQQNLNCGPAGDGCGNEIMCGTCTPPETCGGGGTPGQCGVLDSSTCKPLTCASQHIMCGPAGDGCGNLIQCGSCSGTQTCGGGGTPGVCGGGSQ